MSKKEVEKKAFNFAEFVKQKGVKDISIYEKAKLTKYAFRTYKADPGKFSVDDVIAIAEFFEIKPAELFKNFVEQITASK